MSGALSSYYFPGTNEFILYPSPKTVVEQPTSEVKPFMFAELDRKATLTWADFETVRGLGQLARLMKLDNVEPELEGWLDAHPTPKGYDTAALFLGGFWPNQPATSVTLVDRLLSFLTSHSESLSLIETFVIPLAAAWGSQNFLTRERIQAAFTSLLPLYPLLQQSSQMMLAHVLGLVAPNLPKARPELGDFQAYACKEETLEFITIEHRESGREIVRVYTLTPNGTVLLVEYEILIVTCRDAFARSLIAEKVLVELLGDSYRSQTVQVQYQNRTIPAPTLSPYPPPVTGRA